MSKFSKRHYEAVASLLRNRYNNTNLDNRDPASLGEEVMLKMIVDDFIDLFEEDSVNFSPLKFKRAIYGG
jgi:hypothetical protein